MAAPIKKALVAPAIALLVVILGILLAPTIGLVRVLSVELYAYPDRVTEAETQVDAVLAIRNDLPLGIRIGGGELRLVVDGLELARATIPAQTVGRGETSLLVSAVLNNSLIDELWYGHLSRGEKSRVKVEGVVNVDMLLGSVGIPVRWEAPVETRVFPVEVELNRELDLSVLGKVVVKSVRVELAGVTPSETKLRILVTVNNQLRGVPLYVSGLVYSVGTETMVLGYGEQEYAKSIAPGETDVLPFTGVIDNSKIPRLWCEHVRNGGKTKLLIKVWLKAEIAGRRVELFRDHPLTVSTEVRTKVFKYK